MACLTRFSLNLCLIQEIFGGHVPEKVALKKKTAYLFCSNIISIFKQTKNLKALVFFFSEKLKKRNFFISICIADLGLTDFKFVCLTIIAYSFSRIFY